MKLLERLTSQLRAKGIKDARAMAVRLLLRRKQMKGGKLTELGKQRQALGNAGRAKDRAAKYAGRKPKDYKYNPKTNLAMLK